LNLFESKIAPLDPPSPKTPPRTKHEMDRITSPVAEIWPFASIGAYGTPILGGRGGRRGSAMTPLERAMVVSYMLSIVTVALSGGFRGYAGYAVAYPIDWTAFL